MSVLSRFNCGWPDSGDMDERLQIQIGFDGCAWSVFEVFQNFAGGV